MMLEVSFQDLMLLELAIKAYRYRQRHFAFGSEPDIHARQLLQRIRDAQKELEASRFELHRGFAGRT
jgi:hypothetical protein